MDRTDRGRDRLKEDLDKKKDGKMDRQTEEQRD
jgi:hypothetical protein